MSRSSSYQWFYTNMCLIKGFEVATWKDSRQDQLLAKLVLGPTGIIKSAWENSTSDFYLGL